MIGLLRAESLKLRTSRLMVGLTVAMALLLTLVVLVHGFALAADGLTRTGQRHVFGLAGLGALFAALLGALSITNEMRTGTIRPTFLAAPCRHRVLLAKTLTAAVAGGGYGVVAAGLALGLGWVALASRGIPLRLSTGDYGQLLAGSAAGAALWAVIGIGVGALVRNQVAATVSLAAWMLFVESVLLGQLPAVFRFFPVTAAAALSGSTIGGEVPSGSGLLAPGVAGLLLAGYAVVLATAGVVSVERRDVP